MFSFNRNVILQLHCEQLHCGFQLHWNPEFRNSGIPEFRILEFWNSGTPQMDHFKARSGKQSRPSKWPISGIPEFQNSRIRILEFWNSGTAQMDHFEGRSGKQSRPLKLSIWGVPEFQNSRIPEFQNPEFWDPGVLDFWRWPI